MVQWHWDLHKRKPTGGKKRPYRKKRRYERGGEPVLTLIGDRKVKIKRQRGGGLKYSLASDYYANVVDSETGTCKKVKILRVIANKASRDYERRGVITKGAIIETEAGKARVTSRPGQDGIINAILLRE
ncbi:MAG: 30S ribosomal protein S8e [Thaumarchaeota archaeon]|jgi:small subunit ribosomal protein S8e|nr:30S ribosomal protein S8e [Candidatus Geocrenenecus arthurdayi]MCL7391112.1 30S ribosomal protein S8e [Candidatus Geocrenenecus arthurdayi]MCL7396270.1 30S ribosomal protein S8e [Candidatus Geocrenenecus arthurdayi]MCL7403952.1 30S ribosomal protein S8e [Candidatus Geocrenenecus arthurdayi]